MNGTIGYQVERLLVQHFAPLVAEAEAIFDALAGKLSQRGPDTLDENDIAPIFRFGELPLFQTLSLRIRNF